MPLSLKTIAVLYKANGNRGFRELHGILIILLNLLWLLYNNILSRWKIVIHGGIDGYSRMPVYLHASDNNRSCTVLQLFIKAVEEYGLPSRVRCDQGGENFDVGTYMLELRGTGRGSIIAGKVIFILT